MGARGTYRISSMAARLGQERAVPGARPPLLAFGVLSFLALAALPVAAAGPELTQEWRRCRGDEVRSSEVAIQSCTAIIRSGREKGAGSPPRTTAVPPPTVSMAGTIAPSRTTIR